MQNESYDAWARHGTRLAGSSYRGDAAPPPPGSLPWVLRALGAPGSSVWQRAGPRLPAGVRVRAAHWREPGTRDRLSSGVFTDLLCDFGWISLMILFFPPLWENPPDPSEPQFLHWQSRGQPHPGLVLALLPGMPVLGATGPPCPVPEERRLYWSDVCRGGGGMDLTQQRPSRVRSDSPE